MSIAYSFSKIERDGSGRKTNSPSPDTYEIERGMKIVKDQSPEWTFARDEQHNIHGGGPGPGAYEGDMNKMKMNVSYTMGSKTCNQSPSKGSQFQIPGPGSYEPTLQNKTPTYTMGGKRQDQRLDMVPGPGYYEASQNNALLNSNRKGMSPFGSKSKRDISQMNQSTTSQNIYSPGPGQYSPKHSVIKHKTPSAKIQGHKGISRKDLSPGPGAYNGYSKEIGKSSQNVSMGQRPQTAKKDNNPGPGSYQYHNKSIHENLRSQRGIASMKNQSQRISPVSRDQISSPGPGAYDANIHAIKDKVRNCGFGKTQRGNFITKEEQNRPGPGNYEVKHAKNSSSFKFGQKNNQSFKNQNPGPGNYDPNPNVIKDSIRNVKLGNKLSKSVLNHSRSTNEMPGPGSYYQGHNFGQNAQSFSMRGKPQDNQRNNSPGPGQYDLHDTLSKDRIPSATIMGSKRQNDFYQTSQAPGPGQYNDSSKDFAKNTKSFTFKQRPHDNIDTKSPGPGYYDASNALVKPLTQSYKVSQSQRQGLVSSEMKNKPGPGQYANNHKQFGKDVPQYTMGRKADNHQQTLSPGPGAYDASQQQVKDSVRNFKMSTSQRPDIAPKTAREKPGPGTYESPQKFGQNVTKFTMQSKRSELKKDQVPGPGQYDALNTINRDKSPSFRMGTGQRTQIIGKETINSPGPGIYDQKSSFGQNCPKYTFQSKKEVKLNDHNPGPGNYDPNKSYVKDKVVSYQMGTSQRQKLVSQSVMELPGPGNYGSPTKQGHNNPKYTMGGRSKSRQELSPGPGQYEPRDFLTKDKTVAHAMSSSVRQDIVHKSARELPGPGAYSKANEFGKEVKSFQMRGRPEDTQKNYVPGPGNYEADPNVTKDRVVSHKMSKSMRADIVTKEMMNQPGPGEYDSPHRFGKDVPSVTIRGRPEDIMRDQNPGPGNYSPEHGVVKDKVISYAMGSSKRVDIVQKHSLDQPGPGIYDQASTLGKTVQYTMGSKAKEQQNSKIPGPGSYDPNQNLTKDQVKAFKMSQSQRAQLVSNEEMSKPGPGNYSDSKGFGQDAKSFQMRGRPQDKVGNDIPGPGNYESNTNAVKDRTIAYKMGTQNRGDLVSRERSLTPGPGQYESPSKQSGKTVKQFSQYSQFTMGGRNDSPQRNDIPGPGQYDPNESITKHNNPSFKMNDGSKRADLVTKEQMSIPGPGIYSSSKNFGDDSKSFQMRGRPQDKQGNEIPGPGNYDPSFSQNKDRTVAYKMGTQNRGDIVLKEHTLSPGPGNYDSPSKQSGPNVKFHFNNLQYTMGARNDSPNRNNIPGPGQYQPNESVIKYASPSYKMDNKSMRTKLVSSEQLQKPGPGNYSNTKNFGEGSRSFQIKGKPQDKIGNDNPGPGNYDPSLSQIKDRAVAYKMRSQSREESVSRERQLSPGPGQYDQQSRINGPNYTMGARTDSPPKNNVPGPGQYDPNESVVKYQSPTYKMNDKTQRSNLVSNEKISMPGPGNYDQHSALGKGPVFSMQGRQSQQKSDNRPGPGHYDANIDTVKDHTSHSFRMGTNKRDFLSPSTQDQPGPGFYDVNKGPTGPFFSIKGREQDRNRNDIPGPGTYDGSDNAVRHRNPSISFSHSPDRSRSPQKDNLSGSYEYDNRDYNLPDNQAIVYSIPKADKQDPINDVPGPGHYKLPVKLANVPRYNRTVQSEEFRWV